jgi:hypothetical protein
MYRSDALIPSRAEEGIFMWYIPKRFALSLVLWTCCSTALALPTPDADYDPAEPGGAGLPAPGPRPSPPPPPPAPTPEPVYDWVCGGLPPTFHFGADIVSVAQQPGQKRIAFTPNAWDAILIIVEDAASAGMTLTPNEIGIEIDFDPFSTSRWNKAIESRRNCGSLRIGVIEAQMAPLSGGVICDPVWGSDDMRYGCTEPQRMVLHRGVDYELWLRKPGFLGIWVDVAMLDPSIWDAFAGRFVRFIWRRD